MVRGSGDFEFRGRRCRFESGSGVDAVVRSAGARVLVTLEHYAGRTPVPPPMPDWGRQDGTLNDDTELQVPSPPPRGTRALRGARLNRRRRAASCRAEADAPAAIVPRRRDVEPVVPKQDWAARRSPQLIDALILVLVLLRRAAPQLPGPSREPRACRPSAPPRRISPRGRRLHPPPPAQPTAGPDPRRLRLDRRCHNLLLIGPTGIGKSFLSCAFVERACRRSFTARYVRMPPLLHVLAVGRGDGS